MAGRLDASTATLARNVAATGLSRVGAIALDAVTYVVVARALGPGSYGQYVAVIGAVGLADLTADLTLMDLTVRAMAREPARTGAWLSAATVLRLALALLGTVVLAGYGMLRPDSLPPAALAVAALMLAAAALRTPLAVFRAHLRMEYELVILLATRAANLLAVVLVAAAGGGVLALLSAALGARVLLAVLAWGWSWRRFGPPRSFASADLRHLAHEGLPLAASGALVALQLKGDLPVVTARLGAAAGGVYGAVAQLPEYLLYVPVIFSTPALPLLSRAWADGDRRSFGRLLQGLLDTVLAAAIPLATVAVIAPGPAVLWAFGEAYLPGAELLPTLLASVVCMWASHALAIATVAAGRQHHFLWIQGVCATLFVAVDAWLIPRLGLQGAAIGRLAAAALAPVLTYVMLRRTLGITLHAGALVRAAGAAIVTAAIVAAGRGTVPFPVLAAVGLTAYAGTLWAAGLPRLVAGASEEKQA